MLSIKDRSDRFMQCETQLLYVQYVVTRILALELVCILYFSPCLCIYERQTIFFFTAQTVSQKMVWKRDDVTYFYTKLPNFCLCVDTLPKKFEYCIFHGVRTVLNILSCIQSCKYWIAQCVRHFTHTLLAKPQTSLVRPSSMFKNASSARVTSFAHFVNV